MIKEEIINIFNEKLDLKTMSEEEVTNFYASLIRYLDHGRKKDGDLKGRTIEYIGEKLDKFISFYLCLGTTKNKMVEILTNFPSILNNVDDLYYKYLILGVIENETNSVRKEKFINNPKDLMVSIKSIYIRYKLISFTGYNIFTWSNMVNHSFSRFAMTFIKKEKYKKYQIFNSMQELNNWIENNSFDLNIDNFKDLNINKEMVEKYENKEFRM